MKVMEEWSRYTVFPAVDEEAELFENEEDAIERLKQCSNTKDNSSELIVRIYRRIRI